MGIYLVSGLINHNVLPFMGVQVNLPVVFLIAKGTRTITRKFRVITYQAYNAFGMIAPEDNGVAILDKDQHMVVCSKIGRESTGWFGVSQAQADEAGRIAALPWSEFKMFVNMQPSLRDKIVA